MRTEKNSIEQKSNSILIIEETDWVLEWAREKKRHVSLCVFRCEMLKLFKQFAVRNTSIKKIAAIFSIPIYSRIIEFSPSFLWRGWKIIQFSILLNVLSLWWIKTMSIEWRERNEKNRPNWVVIRVHRHWSARYEHTQTHAQYLWNIVRRFCNQDFVYSIIICIRLYGRKEVNVEKSTFFPIFNSILFSLSLFECFIPFLIHFKPVFSCRFI